MEAGVKLINSVGEGLIKAIPQLISKLPQIISSIVKGLIEGIPQLIAAGGEMLAGLFTGLLNPANIWNAVKSLFNSIIDGLKSLFGIHSPSTVFRDEIGKNLALGIGVGFEDNIKGVKKAMVKSMDGMAAELGNVNINATQGTVGGQPVVVNQYNTFSQAHSRYELFKTKQQTEAAVRLAVGGASA